MLGDALLRSLHGTTVNLKYVENTHYANTVKYPSGMLGNNISEKFSGAYFQEH